jgi:predicted DCC family thiol-disulfide oxidoreductase YuxK
MGMFDDATKILFYDGDCGLCQQSIQFIMLRDSDRKIFFAPLQGQTAEALLPKALRESLSTIVYRRDAEVTLLRSTAVLQALIDTNSSWRFVARISSWVPVCIRDWFYARIAGNRKRIFKIACRLPSPEERKQILS